MHRVAAGVSTAITALVLAGVLLVVVSASYPVPDRWNPFAPLDPTAEPTLFTSWKVARAAGDAALCRTAMARGGAFAPAIPDRVTSSQCHLRSAVNLRQLGQARLAPVDVPCPVALRLFLWERHDLQPAARDMLGSPVAQILHYGAYSCREVRTTSGTGAPMSAHATGSAVDIAGFVLEDGRRLTLAADWERDDGSAQFLRVAQDGLCAWFTQVLGPRYNRLHADHFHAAVTGWPVCR